MKKEKKQIIIPKTRVQKLKLNHKKLLIIIAILLGIIAAFLFIPKNSDNTSLNKVNTNSNNEETSNKQEDGQKTEKEKLSVYDEDSNQRPYAVMIPNAGYEQKRQYGIQKAYIVYEMVVEGGLTRFMALFKDVDVDKIGPIRSCRHYYLDYALENDALYIHWGGNTEYAYPDIKKYGINNIDGIAHDSEKKYEDGKVPENLYFWRDSQYSAPNNGFTSTDRIKNALENDKTYKNYRTSSEDYKLLNYKKNVDLSNDKTVKDANTITIKYNSGSVKYVYDEYNKYYLRYNNKTEHIDQLTKEQVHVKNIIVVKADSKTIPNDPKGRQDYLNIGTGEGYYITEGKAIKINWRKDKRTSKTVYEDSKGNEIKVNDGNTFIQIQPIKKDLIIE